LQPAATTWSPYDSAQLHPQVHAAVQSAREAERQGNQAAQRARASREKHVIDDTLNQRYEGQGHAIDGTRIFGATVFRNGDSYVGGFRSGRPAVRQGIGVYRKANGERYEGQWSNDHRNGYGVLWDANGRVVGSGVWANGYFTTSLSR
jgi:hypothetical protein